jgi:hypothetical protein
MWVEVGVAGLVKECLRVLNDAGLAYTFAKGDGDLDSNVNEAVQFAKAVGIWRRVLMFGSELGTREVFDAIFDAVRKDRSEIQFVFPAFKEGYSGFVSRVWGARGDGEPNVGDVVRVGVGRGSGDDFWVGFERVLGMREGGYFEEWKGGVGVKRAVL